MTTRLKEAQDRVTVAMLINIARLVATALHVISLLS